MVAFISVHFSFSFLLYWLSPLQENASVKVPTRMLSGFVHLQALLEEISFFLLFDLSIFNPYLHPAFCWHLGAGRRCYTSPQVDSTVV